MYAIWGQMCFVFSIFFLFSVFSLRFYSVHYSDTHYTYLHYLQNNLNIQIRIARRRWKRYNRLARNVFHRNLCYWHTEEEEKILYGHLLRQSTCHNWIFMPFLCTAREMWKFDRISQKENPTYYIVTEPEIYLGNI